MDFLNNSFSTERETLTYDIWYIEKTNFELHLEGQGEVWKKTLGWKSRSAALLLQAWPWGERAFSSNQEKKESLWRLRLLRLKMTKLKGLRSGAWHTCPHSKLSCGISARSNCFCGKLRCSLMAGGDSFNSRWWIYCRRRLLSVSCPSCYQWAMKLAPTKLTTGHPSSHCGYAFALLLCRPRDPTSCLISGHLISTHIPPFCLKFGVPKCFPFPLPLSGLYDTVHAFSFRFPPERFDPASLEGVQALGQA